MTSISENPHLGTALDDFLAEDGLLERAGGDSREFTLHRYDNELGLSSSERSSA